MKEGDAMAQIENGIKIKNIKAGTLYGYMLGVRER